MSTTEQTASEATKGVLDRFYAAVATLNEAELNELVAEDAELHQPPTLPYGGIYRGVKGMIELWQKVVIPLANPDTVFVDSMIIDGEHAVVIAGADTKNGGKRMLASEDYLVRDGKIRRIRMFWFDPRPVAEEATSIGITGPLSGAK